MRQRSINYFWTRRSFVSRGIKVLLMAALGATLFLNVFFLALQHDSSSRHKEASSHRQPRNLRQQVSKGKKLKNSKCILWFMTWLLPLTHCSKSQFLVQKVHFQFSNFSAFCWPLSAVCLHFISCLFTFLSALCLYFSSAVCLHFN